VYSSDESAECHTLGARRYSVIKKCGKDIAPADVKLSPPWATVFPGAFFRIEISSRRLLKVRSRHRLDNSACQQGRTKFPFFSQATVSCAIQPV
jgi:hypothetical protein